MAPPHLSDGTSPRGPQPPYAAAHSGDLKAEHHAFKEAVLAVA